MKDLRKRATMKQLKQLRHQILSLRHQILSFANLLDWKANLKQQDKAMKLITRLDRLCGDLENEMMRQHPDEATNVFFGD